VGIKSTSPTPPSSRFDEKRGSVYVRDVMPFLLPGKVREIPNMNPWEYPHCRDLDILLDVPS
jgi:hypothetical protein